MHPRHNGIASAQMGPIFLMAEDQFDFDYLAGDLEDLKALGAVITCCQLGPCTTGAELAGMIGSALPGHHAPYGRLWRVELRDDTWTARTQMSGFVVFLDGASNLGPDNTQAVLDLIQIFAIEHHKWRLDGKPFAICINRDPVHCVADMLR